MESLQISGRKTPIRAASPATRAQFAYERVLAESEQHKVDATSKRLDHLCDVVHLWVRDARTIMASKRPSSAKRAATPSASDAVADEKKKKKKEIDHFSIRARTSFPIQEIRDLIHQRCGVTEEENDCPAPPFELLLNGRILANGKTLKEYLPVPGHRKTGWVRPYVGVIWIVPFRPSLGFQKAWGPGNNINNNKT